MAEEKKHARRAAALKYNPNEDDVPVLAAYGEGHMADRIIAAAEDAGVPVVPDPDLAAMLAGLSVGDEIPPALYEVVAKVLVFVSEMDKSYGSRIKSAAGAPRGMN